MKVLDYALRALAASTDVAQHPRRRAAIAYPTIGFDSQSLPYTPHEPVQTPSATTLPSRPPAEMQHVKLVVKPRDMISNNQAPDPSKELTIANDVQPMLGLYPEDQVTTETTTFENGIDSTRWIVDMRGYGGSIDNPYMRQMEPDNVKVVNGCLELSVPAGQTYDPKSTVGLSSAQIMSVVKFSVGSLEMKVKMSSVEGTCQCGFLYGADNNEVDMEYLTRTNVNWGVVQGMGKEQPIQQVDLNISTVQTDSFRTYKLVRTETKAYFLMDGQLVNTFEKNIPTEPVQAMVAHWTDANPGWTGGPPMKDTTMFVEKIVVEYVGATEIFTTSTAVPSPTQTPGSSPSAEGTSPPKKGAASRTYGLQAGPLLAIAALCFYFAL